jgi:hypothetical protein
VRREPVLWIAAAAAGALALAAGAAAAPVAHPRIREAVRHRVPAPIPRTKGPIAPIRTHPLLVTHASRVYDPVGIIEAGVNDEVRLARAEGRPVVYLIADDGRNDALWLTADRRPDLAIPSTQGEHRLEIDADEITVAGGWLELCQAATVRAAAESFFRRHPLKRIFRVNYPLRATYVERASFRDPGDASSPIPELLEAGRDLTLAEARFILGPQRFVDAVLSSLSYLSDYYEIRTSLDGIWVSRAGSGTGPRRLEIRFVDR